MAIHHRRRPTKHIGSRFPPQPRITRRHKEPMSGSERRPLHNPRKACARNAPYLKGRSKNKQVRKATAKQTYAHHTGIPQKTTGSWHPTTHLHHGTAPLRQTTPTSPRQTGYGEKRVRTHGETRHNTKVKVPMVISPPHGPQKGRRIPPVWRLLPP